MKQKDKEQTNEKKQRGKRRQRKKNKQMTNKRISELTEQKTKYRGSCIQSNRLVSLIKDIVASKIILFAIMFNNGDPYRSSVQKDFRLYCEISKPGISEIW